MLPYFLLIFSVSVMAFIHLQTDAKRNIYFNNTFFFTFILLIVFIGFRLHISGDWSNYLIEYYADDFRLIVSTEILSDALLLLCRKLGLDFSGFVFIQSLICCLCLFIFISKLKFPYIGLLFAIPTLISIVFMGYIKQSMAVSFSLIAIIYFFEKKYILFASIIILSSFFHISSLMLFSIIFALRLNFYIYATPFIVFSLLLVFLGYLDTYIEEYIILRAVSFGAPLRTFLNVIPLFFLIFFKNNWKNEFDNYNIVFWIGIINVLIFLSSFFVSNFADRLSFYFIFYQIYIFGNLLFVIPNYKLRQILILYFILQTTIVFYIWLSFGLHSNWWLPYTNILYQDCIVDCGNEDVIIDSIRKNYFGKLN